MDTFEFIKLQELINGLSDKISAFEKKKPEPRPYQSKEIKDLAAAFCVAQSHYPLVIRNSRGYNYMFADMSQILEQVRGPLSEQGISFFQFIEESDGSIILHTRLLHSSGQWIESRFRVLCEADRVKEFGSALTYLRRQAAIGLLGIHPEQEDDDGEEATKRLDAEDVKGTSIDHNNKIARPRFYETITGDQLEELEYELDGWKDIAKDILKRLDIRSLSEMPKKHFFKHISRIREIKLARSGMKQK